MVGVLAIPVYYHKYLLPQDTIGLQFLIVSETSVLMTWMTFINFLIIRAK